MIFTEMWLPRQSLESYTMLLPSYSIGKVSYQAIPDSRQWPHCFTEGATCTYRDIPGSVCILHSRQLSTAGNMQKVPVQRRPQLSLCCVIYLHAFHMQKRKPDGKMLLVEKWGVWWCWCVHVCLWSVLLSQQLLLIFTRWQHMVV